MMFKINNLIYFFSLLFLSGITLFSFAQTKDSTYLINLMEVKVTGYKTIKAIGSCNSARDGSIIYAGKKTATISYNKFKFKDSVNNLADKRYFRQRQMNNPDRELFLQPAEVFIQASDIICNAE